MSAFAFFVAYLLASSGVSRIPSVSLNFVTLRVGLGDASSAGGGTKGLFHSVCFVKPRGLRSAPSVCVIHLSVVVPVRYSDIMAGVMGCTIFSCTYNCVVIYIAYSVCSCGAGSSTTAVPTTGIVGAV